MKTFGGIPEKYATFEASEVLLQSIPYDGTSTWGKGADTGFDIFLEAAENMELYDIETGLEVYEKGIHILPVLEENSSPEAVYETVRKLTADLLKKGKYLTFIGGEHSVSIGIIEAFRQKYRNLTVLQLDAHADLRESYLGSRYNHACAMHQASKTTNLIQVGIRSMDSCELEYVNNDRFYTTERMQEEIDWVNQTIELMTDNVYLTIDLDALDPSIMPYTGTPEPGGLGWNEITGYLRQVFTERNVVGFDIVEFAPTGQLKSPGFLVAKLYYKLLSYQFAYGKKR